MAEDGRQNIRDNSAARVAGPGRICFLQSELSTQADSIKECRDSHQGIALSDAESRALSIPPSAAEVGTAILHFQFDDQRQVIRTDALTGLRRDDTNITADHAMIDRNHQQTKIHERRTRGE